MSKDKHHLCASPLPSPRVVPLPPPAHDAGHVKVKLSFLDVQWIATPPIQLVILYELASGDEFPAVVRRLKESLAGALSLCLPLAGKLAYVEETEDVVVDFSDGGVSFFEADGRGVDVPSVLALVPELDTRVLPAPVLAVQATQLEAGMALGVSVHHAVFDGRAIGRFIEAWASASHGCSNLMTKSHGTPDYSREAIAMAYPRGEELAREILKKVAPGLPVFNMTDYDVRPSCRLACRTFYLSSHDIRSLKWRIEGLAVSSEAGGQAPKYVSTFVALSELGWVAFVQSKGLAAGEGTYLAFSADLRTRLRPTISENDLGNCIKICLASADVGLFLGEAGLLHASRAIQAALGDALAAPLAGTEKKWTEPFMNLPLERLVWVSGSPLFPYKMANFGFGRPTLAEGVPVNHDGRLLLLGGRKDGETQMSVTLDQARMEAFMAHINEGPRARI